MSMFATPKIADRGDELNKDDIVGDLAVFEVVDFDPNTVTKYGTSPTLNAVVTVVDGDHAGRVESRFYAAGNLARQIGGALEPGQMAPGRIVQGSSANGRSWYGIDWAVDPADLQRAEQAMAPAPKPVAKPQPLREQVRAAKQDIRQNVRQAAYTDQEAPF